jgi:glycerate dehydrogenase
MRIVVVDSYTLNPGDLSWAPLEELGGCTFYDRTGPGELLARAHGAEIVITNKVPMCREEIESLPELVYVGVSATGYDMVDLDAARERGIVVTNVPTYGTDSVAQMAFAHLLNLTQRVAYHAQTVREGRWAQSPDFSYWDYPLVELAGLTLGIVGYGRIGRRVAEIARAFCMDVLVNDPEVPDSLPEGVRFADLETLFQTSDVVSLHCPLTPETEGLVDAPRLASMKEGAFLINTSRGPLVDQQALADALNADHLGGAGLDVLATEPPDADNPLLGARNCTITPHIAWATRSARARLLGTTIANVAAWLAGDPQNVVAGG